MPPRARAALLHFALPGISLLKRIHRLASPRASKPDASARLGLFTSVETGESPMGDNNPNPKPEQNQTARRTWGQRAEIVLIGATGTAVGHGVRNIVKLGISKIADKAV